jgi:hypothetical protein
MKRLLLGAAVCMVSLAFGSVAQAQPGLRGPVGVRPIAGPLPEVRGIPAVTRPLPGVRVDVGFGRPALGVGHPGVGLGHPGVVGVRPAVRPYPHLHGVRFAGGVYYRGLEHRHWDHCIWDARLARYHYWDPFLSCYYFYCPIRAGFYPVTAVSPVVIDPWR